MQFTKINPKNLVVRYEGSWWNIVSLTQEKVTIKNAHKELTLNIDEVEVNVMEDTKAHAPTTEEPWS